MIIKALIDRDFHKRKSIVEPLGFVQSPTARFVWNLEVHTVEQINAIEQALKGKVPYRKEM